MLYDGCTINDHFNQTGVDLSKTALLFAPITTINGYRARLDNHTLHEIVRFDPNVKLVEHNYRVISQLKNDTLFDASQQLNKRAATPRDGIEDKIWWREYIYCTPFDLVFSPPYSNREQQYAKQTIDEIAYALAAGKKIALRRINPLVHKAVSTA